MCRMQYFLANGMWLVLFVKLTCSIILYQEWPKRTFKRAPSLLKVSPCPSRAGHRNKTFRSTTNTDKLQLGPNNQDPTTDTRQSATIQQKSQPHQHYNQQFAPTTNTQQAESRRKQQFILLSGCPLPLCILSTVYCLYMYCKTNSYYLCVQCPPKEVKMIL